MRRQAARLLRLSIGGTLLLLGVIGGFIPILQGWIFVVAGLTVIAPESRRARAILDWARGRLHAGLDDVRRKDEADSGAAPPREDPDQNARTATKLRASRGGVAPLNGGVAGGIRKRESSE